MSDFDPSAVDAVLTELREARGWRWKEFAEAAGIDPSTFSAIRGGYRPLTTETATRIAEATELSLADLYGRLARESILEERRRNTRQYSNAIRVGSDSYHLIEGLLEELEPGDEYLIVTSQAPQEFDSPDALLVSGIVQAIRKGVSFHYVFPAMRLEEVAPESNGSDVPRLVDSLLSLPGSPFTVELRFKTWKRQLQREHKIEDLGRLLRGTPVALESGGFLFSPFVKYILVRFAARTGDDTTPRVEAWVEVSPTGVPTVTDSDQCFVRLNSRAAVILSGMCNDLLYDARAESD